jgi:hypothetical protein
LTNGVSSVTDSFIFYPAQKLVPNIKLAITIDQETEAPQWPSRYAKY